ncbi:hydroxypyruvate reductase/glycerate 2-kinase [Monaibacterium marinum]|uniref:Hydroxypyruvate reductase/glycerate 2-kinase n=1 Tax=Pontivivens marinum TaxID=1690039 RepID=A0A2C9CMP5_9RHOB|nr:glycerate kinase [Monaibacterium marinum]SOH92574.1 hydroxypyruvate reductase/glycerate 2-kinase [Monaibacterium marinum]
MTDAPTLLRQMFDAAVAAALPSQVLAGHLPAKPAGRVVVVGAGKASAAMGAALEAAWGPCEGLIVTRYDHAVPCEGIEIVEASHPVPDAAGEDAARRILSLAEGLGEGDLLVALISGGGSSLLSLGADGVSLRDKQALNRVLLASGASIDEMNCVRKHVSAVKGGRLAAAAWPARVLSLVISDVPGDDPSHIASGPTVADATTLQDAREIVARYGMDLPDSVVAALADPANETPKTLDRAELRMIAAPMASLRAAQAICPVPCLVLGDAIEGEAREVGRAMAGMALSVRQHGLPIAPPCILLSGGETTVTLPADATGRGGRNVEFLMGLLDGLDGASGIHAIACDTDGVDGAAEVAGALIGPQTDRSGLNGAMANYDGHGLFARLNAQVITGPTLTNVNDFRAIYIE